MDMAHETYDRAYFVAMGRKGGRATLKKKGKTFFKTISKKGLKAIRARKKKA